LVADGSKPIDLDAIEADLGKTLARFKQPRQLILVESLPRNTMGKVQKNILRGKFGSTFQG
jgi:malonyl-CoA/methylmalonyl-CoA synthetase